MAWKSQPCGAKNNMSFVRGVVLCTVQHILFANLLMFFNGADALVFTI